MRRTTQGYGLALLLALPMCAGAEVSWLDAEVRAQEARWAARQGRSAPLAPLGIAPGTAAPTRNGAAPPARTREKTPIFPPVAARPVPSRPRPAGRRAPRPPTSRKPSWRAPGATVSIRCWSGR